MYMDDLACSKPTLVCDVNETSEWESPVIGDWPLPGLHEILPNTWDPFLFDDPIKLLQAVGVGNVSFLPFQIIWLVRQCDMTH